MERPPCSCYSELRLGSRLGGRSFRPLSTTRLLLEGPYIGDQSLNVLWLQSCPILRHFVLTIRDDVRESRVRHSLHGGGGEIVRPHLCSHRRTGSVRPVAGS